MPKKKRKIPLPGKRWWTVGFLTREALKSDLKPSLHIFGDGFVQRIS